jgi:hypothetical protein
VQKNVKELLIEQIVWLDVKKLLGRELELHKVKLNKLEAVNGITI